MVKLSKQMKNYVLEKSKIGYTKEVRKIYDRRLLQYAREGINDLTFLIDNLPEDMQALIFTEQNLRKLFRALFASTISNNQMSEEKRLRLLNICKSALDEISMHQNGPLLAPNAWKVLKETPSSSYHESMYGTKVIQSIQIEGEVFKSKDRKGKREGDEQ